VASGVTVKSDGTFSAGFNVTRMFGQHTVTATQTAADGSSISPPITSPKAPVTAPLTLATASPALSGTQGAVPVALGVVGLLAILALLSLLGLYVARRRSAEQ
jgi:hypothetical protein